MALHHCFFGSTAVVDAVSGFSYSEDGVTWHNSWRQPYSFNVTVANGSSLRLTTRERPKLLLDPETKAILGMYNGGRDAHGTRDGGKGKLGTDWTFTLFQRVRQAPRRPGSRVTTLDHRTADPGTV